MFKYFKRLLDMPWNDKKIAAKPALGRSLIRAKNNARKTRIDVSDVRKPNVVCMVCLIAVHSYLIGFTETHY